MKYVKARFVITNGYQFIVELDNGTTYLTSRWKGQYFLSTCIYGRHEGYQYQLNKLQWHHLSEFEEIKLLRYIMAQCDYAVSIKSLIELKEKYEKTFANSRPSV